MQQILGRFAGLAVFFGIAMPASADFFLSYFDAPAEVQAGETFTVDLWLEYDGQFNSNADMFSSMATSILLGGSAEANYASTAYRPTLDPPGVISEGVIEGQLLRNAAAFQLFFNGPFNFDNPLYLFSFDVTAGDLPGLISIEHAIPFGFDAVYVDWYFNFDGPDVFTSDDPDIDLFLESTTVRVVPAPASAAMVIAGLAFTRRRCRA